MTYQAGVISIRAVGIRLTFIECHATHIAFVMAEITLSMYYLTLAVIHSGYSHIGAYTRGEVFYWHRIQAPQIGQSIVLSLTQF